MRILVLDLEATCSEDDSIPWQAMEITEVGAVLIGESGEALDTFQRFVKPVTNPVLTDFCKQLTNIAQSDVDGAQPWPEVAAELAAFANGHSIELWGSWGKWDRKQIARESERRGCPDPLAGIEHVNLKAVFAKARKIKQVGMVTALEIAGLKLEGEHHRALADARNIARLLPFCVGLQNCERPSNDVAAGKSP